MAKKPAVVSKISATTVLPKPEPASKVLTVRLPTPIVDALHKHKQEKNIELSAIVRPILEKTLTPVGTDLIENAAVPAESTKPIEVTDESNGLVRLFPWLPSYWESAKSA